MLKKLLGLAPQIEEDGSLRPSKLALKLATTDKTDYKEVSYDAYKGDQKKILVIMTEQKNMKMENGKLFSTGNHPVETLVPMLHLQKAGFEFEIVTPNGFPVILEMWAFPQKDEHVTRIYRELESSFKNPKSIADFVSDSLEKTNEYAGIYLPGGHGAMLGIPEDKNVDKVLRWAHENDLFTISICHGPGGLLASTLDNQEFLYKGYNMCVFPDSVDEQTPMIGYLPGKMPWKLGEKMQELGVNLMNKKADDTVCIDRKLITGASPQASDALGQLAANTLLKELK